MRTRNFREGGGIPGLGSQDSRSISFSGVKTKSASRHCRSGAKQAQVESHGPRQKGLSYPFYRQGRGGPPREARREATGLKPHSLSQGAGAESSAGGSSPGRGAAAQGWGEGWGGPRSGFCFCFCLLCPSTLCPHIVSIASATAGREQGAPGSWASSK